MLSTYTPIVVYVDMHIHHVAKNHPALKGYLTISDTVYINNRKYPRTMYGHFIYQQVIQDYEPGAAYRVEIGVLTNSPFPVSSIFSGYRHKLTITGMSPNILTATCYIIRSRHVDEYRTTNL